MNINLAGRISTRTNWFRKLVFATGGILLSCSSYSQTDDIDAFLITKMQQRNIPGMQIAIVKNGEIVKLGNYGVANLQDSVPVTENTVFVINSITKAFTGVAIMQLVEAGKLNLSLPVSTYLDDLPEVWRSVTIQQLLSHTSGIPDIVDEETDLIEKGEEASWKKVQTLPNDFKPGERFSYNQTNYLVLGRVIDKLSGMPFTELIIKEQLQKVGMTTTAKAGFGGSRDVTANGAREYRFTKGKHTNMYFWLPPSLQTAAGMSSTAKELANWTIALQNKQLLKEDQSLAALWTPARLIGGRLGGFSGFLNGYAVGWPIVAREEHPAAAAVGGNRSAVFVYPDDNLSIIVLTNLMGAQPESFVDELAGFYIPDMKEANGFGLSPSVKLLKIELDKLGYKNAISRVKKIRKTTPTFKLNENEINNWGYTLLKQNRVADALEIFKLNVALYPQSANAFDSLGETYATMGDKALAIKNYEKSVQLNPKNENAIAALKDLN
ncbi:serine hydrolase [Daejeonella oryzae]|uniref:serine hydrolase n=1 Tax=Daejeonella oryzae TaxID=1122943 RepID=UPI00040CE168|nr:serine hydrolase [Daejeonella oryzae]